LTTSLQLAKIEHVFDKLEVGSPTSSPERPGAHPGSGSIKALVRVLRQLDRTVGGDERLAQIRALEELKAAAAAAQARIAVAFDETERSGVGRLEDRSALDRQHAADEQDRDGQETIRRQRQRAARVAAQIAAARRESPHAGARFLRTARALVTEMPCALTALEHGRLSEYRASVVVTQTAGLSSKDRSHVDATGVW
jgi:hypothetical protein